MRTRIAIIGAGPAGLVAEADERAKRGLCVEPAVGSGGKDAHHGKQAAVSGCGGGVGADRETHGIG